MTRIFYKYLIFVCIVVLTACQQNSSPNPALRDWGKKLQTVKNVNTPDDSYAESDDNEANAEEVDINQTWREDLGNGMFAINHGNPRGAHQRTIYRACSSCHGSAVCPNCHGTLKCTICYGQGGIVSAGYGRCIPCEACNQTGLCGLCHGTGKCFCANSEYHGYMAGSTIVIGPDGKVAYNSRDNDVESSPSSTHSQTKSYGGACPKCGGRKYESESYEYSSASAHGWAQPYHNDLGDKCPYCGYASEHYHYPCSECHGFGHS